MRLRVVRSGDVKGKTVLYRAPYDIQSVRQREGLKLADDSRIKVTLPTLNFLLKNDCRIVVLTYVGRPQGKVVEELRTTLHAIRLSELVGRPVAKLDDCIGPQVREYIQQMSVGEIVMLENVRFYPEENANDAGFADKLAQNGEVVVFDGFPQAHRDQASTTGILSRLPAYAGFYLEEEVIALSHVMENPQRLFTLILGGVKAETKIPVIDHLIDRVDRILIGGKLVADELMQPYLDHPKVMLASLREDQLDIDDKTIGRFSQIINQSKTVIWSGPMGKYEDEAGSRGTREIAQAIAEAEVYSLVAGGDTVAAINRLGLKDKFSYVSLAGGATLEFLAGQPLPALEMLLDKN